MNEHLSNQIQVIKSVFKGRTDVFAIRWEKQNKSGYMPAYFYDPYLYQAHKMKGGTFQNYNDKNYLKLTDQEIAKHLNGEQQIGIYPLLQDNNSHFLVADFDEESWIDECRLFMKVCDEKRFPAYLERSRSGNGGHVWVFLNNLILPTEVGKSSSQYLNIQGCFQHLTRVQVLTACFQIKIFNLEKVWVT